ncbi:hypothetical protein GOP47_0003704 [Adiantum capillus-veneris]|uniref:Uncharacterized protein n=1 Tax=Adiantum capillus-veneris TaxID=13818 RepID=A0A9D4V648_ADICA|nr:hypothetical protein GOP47_0003704 [Adiantum capillus-veneris]
MDDKDSSRCPSKEGTSALSGPAAIARRKRMEILRFKKLSYTTNVIWSDSSVLKRARPSAANEFCHALEDSEDIDTPSPKLQREEGSNCVQTKGKEVAGSPNLLEDHRNDLSSTGPTHTQMEQVSRQGLYFL